MYSTISSAACPRLSKVRACTHSALTRPIGDSMAALSQGGEIAPIEGLMPFSLMVRPSRSDTYCDPRSEWRVQPAGGLLRAIAILSASSASPASMRSDIDQPTALPGHMPITSARQGHPRRVRTQAMSANRALSGPSAVKSRPTRARLSHSHFFHLKNASSAAMMTRLSAMTVAYPYSQLSSGMFEKFMPYHPVMVVMGTKMDATTVR